MATMRKRRCSAIGIRENQSSDEHLDLFQRDAQYKPKSSKRMKLKMSPFPEIQGEEIGISRGINKVDNSSKTSLEMTAFHSSLEIAASPAAAVGTAVSPSLLRPSEVKSLERQMVETRVLKQQPRVVRTDSATSKGDSSEQLPTASLSNMWGSVVNWMRAAVDFVGLDGMPVAEPSLKRRTTSSKQSGSSPERKLPLQETNDQARPSKQQNAAARSKRANNRRMSLGMSLHQTNKKSLEMPKLESAEPQTSDGSTKLCTTRSLLDSAQKYTKHHDGLNSLMDSPAPIEGQSWKIRNSALRKFYCSTVDSPPPNPPLRRSPRIAAKQAQLPPPPPPPPPPPLPPMMPPPPPPLPSTPLANSRAPGTPTSQRLPMSQSQHTLQRMQSRLRSRIMRKGVDDASPLTTGRGREKKSINIKSQQWAEIQARRRKIPVADFLVLAENKKKETQGILEGLQDKVPSTVEQLAEVMEQLQDGALWFPGGSKEMKECLPLYGALEKRIELMNECVQIQNDMHSISTEPSPLHSRSFTDVHTYLGLVCEEMAQKEKLWSNVLQSGAKSWVSAGLPVDTLKLSHAQDYLFSLADRFVSLTVEEGGKINGVMCSIKSSRATRTKEKLQQALTMAADLLPYVQGSVSSDKTWNIDQLLTQSTDIAVSFVNIFLREFDGYVQHNQRQVVCEHFEAVLKVLNKMKSIVTKISHLKSAFKSKGLISVLPSGEELGSLLYSSCVKLIEHIAAKAKALVSSGDAGCQREIMLWMMFGCKYVNQTLEVLGSDQADERGVQELLAQLEQMENLLPP